MKKKTNRNFQILNEFIAFGSKKRVFWSITIVTIIFIIIGVLVAIVDKSGTQNYLIKLLIMLFLLEIIYIGIYSNKKGRKKKESKIKNKLKRIFKLK
jgi:uncharacterized membrane protein YfcA